MNEIKKIKLMLLDKWCYIHNCQLNNDNKCRRCFEDYINKEFGTPKKEKHKQKDKRRYSFKDERRRVSKKTFVK